MIDMINFTIVFLASFFALATAFYGIFQESRVGYIVNDALIAIVALLAFGGYGVFISLKYILQVSWL